MTHQDKITVRYVGEMIASLLLYAGALVVSIHYGERLPQGPAQTALALMPMAPFLLMIVVVARQLRRVDEYVRRHALESIAIAAAVTAGWTFTYGFLEGIGYPRLSMFSVWEGMGAAWAVVAIARACTGR